MKKFLTSVILISLLAVPAVNVLAQSNTTGQQTVPENLDMIQVLNNIVDWLFTILLVVAALFIIIAAFYFITASGNPETVAKARNFVLYALVGVAVAVAARGLVALIQRIVGGGQ
jgi:hypothetical protein